MPTLQWSADGHYYRIIRVEGKGNWVPIDPSFPPFEGVPSNSAEEVADDDPRLGAAEGSED